MDKILCSRNLKFAGIISIAIISCGFLSTFIKRRKNKSCAKISKPRKWIRVGNVSKLIIYPIKSCIGIEVPEAIATEIGLKGLESNALRDRIFLVVDSHYVFQTQRTLPKMALIKAEVKGQNLIVSGPGMETLEIQIPENLLPNKRSCRVKDDHVREVLDCGNEIGKWLDTFLEDRGYRLVYHALDQTQRTMTPLQKKFPFFYPQDKGAFQDQTSYMLLSEESLAHLNTKLKRAVTAKNFRPCILINGIPEAFAEDLWAYVRIGGPDGPVLKTALPCTRCRLTTVNPSTGEFDPEGQPLQTLQTIKRSFEDPRVDELVQNMGVLGIRLGLYEGGNTIRVGDPVYAALL